MRWLVCDNPGEEEPFKTKINALPPRLLLAPLPRFHWSQILLTHMKDLVWLCQSLKLVCIHQPKITKRKSWTKIGLDLKAWKHVAFYILKFFPRSRSVKRLKCSYIWGSSHQIVVHQKECLPSGKRIKWTKDFPVAIHDQNT